MTFWKACLKTFLTVHLMAHLMTRPATFLMTFSKTLLLPFSVTFYFRLSKAFRFFQSRLLCCCCRLQRFRNRRRWSSWWTRCPPPCRQRLSTAIELFRELYLSGFQIFFSSSEESVWEREIENSVWPDGRCIWKSLDVCIIKVCQIQNQNHAKISQRLLKFCQSAEFRQIWTHRLRSTVAHYIWIDPILLLKNHTLPTMISVTI